MDQLSSDRLVVVAVERMVDGCILSLEDGGREARFEVRLEDVDGIALMVGTEPLSKWLGERGQRWAQPLIHRLVQGAMRNEPIEVPKVLVASRGTNAMNDEF